MISSMENVVRLMRQQQKDKDKRKTRNKHFTRHETDDGKTHEGTIILLRYVVNFVSRGNN